MNEQLQTISDEQKKTWDNVSHAWKKWNEFTMNFPFSAMSPRKAYEHR